MHPWHVIRGSEGFGALLMRPGAVRNKRFFSCKIYVGKVTTDTMARGKNVFRELARLGLK